MPKIVEISIKEDLSFLKSLRNKDKNYRKKTRLQSLILTKEKKFKRRSDLAQYLGIGRSSLDRWTKVYEESGLEAMLSIESGGLRRSSQLESIHDKLKKKLENSHNPLLGYWDAVLWVEKNFGLKVEYNTLRTYMIRNFKTKLKSPRKSHYKKDEQALTVFKKTTPPA